MLGCYYSPSATKAYKDKVKRAKKGKMVTVWKSLYKIHLDNLNQLLSPYYNQVFTEGWNFSDRKSVKIPHNGVWIYKGIHVYLNEKYGRRKYTRRVCVKCQANIDDFIGCDSHGSGVFSKIYLSEEEYNKVIR